MPHKTGVSNSSVVPSGWRRFRLRGIAPVRRTVKRFMRPLCASALAVFLAFLAAGASATRAGLAPGAMDLVYELHVGGLLVAVSKFSMQFHPDRFDARIAIEPRGLTKLIAKYRLLSRSDGRRTWRGVEPLHFHTEYWKKKRKRRWVDIEYSRGRVSKVKAVPAPWEDRRAVVSWLLRIDALDPVSAALALSEQIERAERCEAALGVYDGRRFFRVRLRHLGFAEQRGPFGELHRGPALRCRLVVDKVTGFKDKELKPGRYPEEITGLLAQIVPGGPWLPTRLEADHKSVRMVVKLVSVEMQGFQPRRTRHH